MTRYSIFHDLTEMSNVGMRYVLGFCQIIGVFFIFGLSGSFVYFDEYKINST
jgi:hypothetical protein